MSASVTFLILLSLVAMLCVRFPQYGGWDVAAYMAIVLPDHSHDAVYEKLRNSLPYPFYDQLVGSPSHPFGQTHPGDDGSEYRRDMALNANHFAEQLPVYRVKFLYPLFIWILWKVGLDLYSAAHWASIMAFLGTGMIVWRWLSLYLGDWSSTLISGAIIVQPYVLQAARAVLPDALSIFVVFAGSYFLFARNDYRHLGSSLLLLSVAVRPDNLIFCLLALAYGRKWRWLVCCLVGAYPLQSHISPVSQIYACRDKRSHHGGNLL